jgi:hypothetical protein
MERISSLLRRSLSPPEAVSPRTGFIEFVATNWLCPWRHRDQMRSERRFELADRGDIVFASCRSVESHWLVSSNYASRYVDGFAFADGST